MSNDIRIFVVDLNAYNNGVIRGGWIVATQDVDRIHGQIVKMLEDGEYASSMQYIIHDHEGFCGYSVDEQEGIEDVQDIAFFIQEHGALGAKFLNQFGGHVGKAKDAMSDRSGL